MKTTDLAILLAAAYLIGRRRGHKDAERYPHLFNLENPLSAYLRGFEDATKLHATNG